MSSILTTLISLVLIWFTFPIALIFWLLLADRSGFWFLVKTGIATLFASAAGMSIGVLLAVFTTETNSSQIAIGCSVIIFVVSFWGIQRLANITPDAKFYEPESPPEPHYLDIGKRKLAYWKLVPTVTPLKSTIIYCHGGPGGRITPAVLEEVGQPFVEKGIAFYAFDQAGSGKSDPLPVIEYCVATFVADIKALVDHTGVAKVSLIGSSWGSVIAARFALRWPEYCEALILNSPVRPQGVVFSELDFSKTAQTRMPSFPPMPLLLALTLIRFAPRTCDKFMSSELAKHWGAVFAKRQVSKALHCKDYYCEKSKINEELSRFAVSLYPAVRLPMTVSIKSNSDIIFPAIPVQVWRGECDYLPLDVAKFYTQSHPESALIEIKREGHAVAFPDNSRSSIAAKWLLNLKFLNETTSAPDL
jgi:pimeloyl-ACP methyl ester carboxylesterase